MIKKFVMDESLSWEERYKQLETHHIEETESLYHRLKHLRKMLGLLNGTRCEECKTRYPADESPK